MLVVKDSLEGDLNQAPSKIKSGEYSELTLDIESVSFAKPFKIVRWMCLI